MDIGKYFASKKRELSSNNSADGDIPKKVKETNVSASSDVSISNDDVTYLLEVWMTLIVRTFYLIH